MQIDTIIRYSKIKHQPHIHLYLEDGETTTKRCYTSLSQCDEFRGRKLYFIIKRAFDVGVHYMEVKHG